MSKMKQIAALTAMLVVVIMYASPAKSAVCFLPDDDGSCGGGDIEISDDSTSENQCADFNLSQNQRNSKEYDSDCYTCEPCTYNGRTTYKCALNSGATWYGGNLSVCCTNGEKYDSAEGKCCPAGGCEHNCPEGQSWDSSAKSCKCDNGKDANGGICCADSEHVSDGICCPEKKHNDGGVCKCDSQYNTDKNGNCVLPNNCTYAYRQATTADSDGVTGDLDNSGKCTNGTQCWKNLWKITSLNINTGTPSVKPINKISSTSATCVDENNVTRYQTICQGTPKSKCFTNNGYEFKTNRCVSSGYNNGFEVKGDEWGDCVKKEEKCLYEYRQATAKDSDDITGDLDGGGKNTCQRGTNCYKKLSQVKSIDIRGGTGKVMPIYNRISKASASCKTLDGVTKYQTICQGTAKDECKRSFTSNGCVSASYYNGFYVAGTEWGTCGCDTSKGLYDTSDECREKTKYGCTLVSSCYRSCESLGYFTKREDCEANMPAGSRCLSPGAKEGNSNCFVRQSNSFTITFAPNQKLMYSCSTQGGVSPSVKMWAYLDNSDSNYTKDINGRSVDLAYKESTFTVPAGTYYLCANSDNPVTISRVTLSTNGGQVMCIGYESGCSRDNTHDSFCQKVTFQKNRNYYVSITAGKPLEWYYGNKVTGCY